jgi:hypothetical protein
VNAFSRAVSYLRRTLTANLPGASSLLRGTHSSNTYSLALTFRHMQVPEDESACTDDELALKKIMQAKEFCSKAYELLHVRTYATPCSCAPAAVVLL